MGKKDIAVAAWLRPFLWGDGQRHILQNREIEWFLTFHQEGWFDDKLLVRDVLRLGVADFIRLRTLIAQRLGDGLACLLQHSFGRRLIAAAVRRRCDLL